MQTNYKESEIVDSALFAELEAKFPNNSLINFKEMLGLPEVNDPYADLHFPKNPIRSKCFLIFFIK
jgi:hypothetical protein